MSAEMPHAPETTRESVTRLTPSFTAASVIVYECRLAWRLQMLAARALWEADR